MSSKIEQLIDEIEEYIAICKYKTLSNTHIIVNKDEIDELLRELKMKTPDEIKRYQKIISNKEAILNDARDKAAALIKEATDQTNELINEHEIMLQAYEQANEVVTLASAQAQDILTSTCCIMCMKTPSKPIWIPSGASSTTSRSRSGWAASSIWAFPPTAAWIPSVLSWMQ